MVVFYYSATEEQEFWRTQPQNLKCYESYISNLIKAEYRIVVAILKLSSE